MLGFFDARAYFEVRAILSFVLDLIYKIFIELNNLKYIKSQYKIKMIINKIQ